MKTKRLLALLSLLVLLLAACSPTAKGVEGKWTSPELGKSFDIGGQAKLVTMEFKNGEIIVLIDGKTMKETVVASMKESGMDDETIKNMTADAAPTMTYQVDGESITITLKMGEESSSDVGTFKREGDKLTITMPDSVLELTLVK